MKIAYLGAGNVAWHLAQAFDEKVSVVQVFSRSLESAKSLCSMLKDSEPICDIADLRCDADVYIVSVADAALQEVLCRVPRHCREKLWLHTSGGCGIEVFPDDFCDCGVLYPLQTFTKGSKLCISDIPFFIEARNPEQTEKIRNLALMLTDKVYEADSERRRTLHIAAVFACNFTNYLYSLSRDILKTADLPFSVMLPLIRTTVGKIEQMPPEKAQTGPAARGDRNVIEAHLATLKDPLQKELYEIFSEEILKNHCK